jgi:hypothetical protein
VIKRVYIDRRKMPIRAYVLFDDDTCSKGKGKTAKLAVKDAIQKAKAVKNG